LEGTAPLYFFSSPSFSLCFSPLFTHIYKHTQDTILKGMPLNGFPHAALASRPPEDLFVGSQPVSLDLENMELLRRKRYGRNRDIYMEGAGSKELRAGEGEHTNYGEMNRPGLFGACCCTTAVTL
jgi:hypothetical protein